MGSEDRVFPVVFIIVAVICAAITGAFYAGESSARSEKPAPCFEKVMVISSVPFACDHPKHHLLLEEHFGRDVAYCLCVDPAPITKASKAKREAP